MPNRAAQAALLARVYHEGAIDPERLAFIEAHGTGTRVGDPAEAFAIGETLGAEAQPRASDRLDQDQYRPYRAGLRSRRHAEGDPCARARSPAGVAALRRAQSRHPVRRTQSEGRDRSRSRCRASQAGAMPASTPSASAARTPMSFSPIRRGASASRKEEGPAPQFFLLSAHSRAALSELASRYAERLDERTSRTTRRSSRRLPRIGATCCRTVLR